MGYTLHEEYSSKNYTPAGIVNATWGQGNRAVQGIVIHHWGSKGQNFWDVNNYLCVNNKPTSAHFVVQDGLVSCIVSPVDASWHAGHGWANAHTIGIECRPEATDGDYQTVAELIAKLRQDFGANIPLSHHNKWQATECPGVYDLGRLDRMANAVSNPAPQAPATLTPVANVPTVTPNEGYVRDPHWVVEKGETLSMVAAHYGVSVDRIAQYNGIKDPNKIAVGEFIWPPVGRDTWTVDPGDTLTSIAAFYGIKPDDIAYTNGINDPTKLAVGVRLQIP